MNYFRVVSIPLVTVLISIVTCLPLSAKDRVHVEPNQHKAPVLWSKVISVPTLTLGPYSDGVSKTPKRSLQTVDALLNIPLRVLCRAGRAVREAQLSKVCPHIVNRSTTIGEIPRELPNSRPKILPLD